MESAESSERRQQQVQIQRLEEESAEQKAEISRLTGTTNRGRTGAEVLVGMPV